MECDLHHRAKDRPPSCVVAPDFEEERVRVESKRLTSVSSHYAYDLLYYPSVMKEMFHHLVPEFSTDAAFCFSAT